MVGGLWTQGVGRALAIGVACAILGYGVAAALTTRRTALRLSAWGLALACYFSPPLLTGYAYANVTGVIGLSPALLAACYAWLVCARLVPAAAVVWLMCPDPVSAESRFCLRLLQPNLEWRDRLVHRWRLAQCGLIPAGLAAFGVCAVMALTEFELAAFLGVAHWTVRVFDAQAGGTALAVSLRHAAWPVTTAAVAVGLVMLGLARRSPRASVGLPGSRRPEGLRPWAGTAWLLLGAATVSLYPATLVLRDALDGVAATARGFTLYRELGASLLVAGTAGLAASLAAGRLTARARHRGRPWGGGVRILAGGVILAGLLGGLVLGLAGLALLQAPLLWRLRETPVPLLVAATVFVMPAATVMHLLLRARRSAPDVHAACLLARAPHRRLRRVAGRVAWVRRDRVVFWGGALLVCQVFYDVTLASLLAPVRMPLVVPRLYNLMHYGHSQVLTGSLLACVLAAPAMLALAAFVYRIGRTWHAAPVDG